METTLSVLLISFMVWETQGYPYYPYYGTMDSSFSLGSSDSSRGGMALSRYYSPYYMPSAGGMAAFMFRPEYPQRNQQNQQNQYYQQDRRRQTEYYGPPPQQNEVNVPILSENPNYNAPVFPSSTELPLTEFPEATEKSETFTTTLKTYIPELNEPEAEEVEEPKRKRVAKKKQQKKPVDDDEDDEEDFKAGKVPSGAFFPMYFAGRSSEGAGGITAIANAYSTGRGGVATSHATAYGPPRPDFKYNSYSQKGLMQY